MMEALFWGGLIVLVMAAVVGVAVWRAKPGYQDKNGFHYGRPPDDFQGE